MDKNILKIALRVVISITFITVLLVKADWQEVCSTFTSVQYGFLALVILVKIAQFPLSTYKWSLSLKAHNLRFQFCYLQWVLCGGFFFNNFLPTSIGGDGYRAIRTMCDDCPKSSAVSAVLVKWLIGFASLLCISFYRVAYKR